MAISSTSTLAQIKAEYMDTLAYRSPINVSLAHRHLNAIRALVMNRPSSATKGANSFGFNVNSLENEAGKVEAWLERHDADNLLSGPDVLYVDFRHNPRSSS